MPKLVRRTQCMKLLESGRDLTDIVKVVTGMRRSGKSTLLEQYKNELLDSGVPEDNIVFLNLEGFEAREISTFRELDVFSLERISPKGLTYFIFDEIQNVEGWEKTISSLINTKTCDVYITGSNSKLLSSELSTHLSGRFIEIKVFPLSFGEYMELHPSADRESSFKDYLRFGSLPEVDPALGERLCDSLLEGTYNSVLVKDIAERLGTNDMDKLIDIARFINTNIGNVTNIDSIAKAVKMSNVTVKRYLSKLEEAYLVYYSEKYDIVGKKVLNTNGKYYVSDLGLRRIILKGAGGTDMSRPLENVVFMELIRRGYVVRVGSYYDKEVDFTAIKDNATEYYQVTLTMMSDDTREREFRSLRGIRDNNRKIILTLDRFGLGSDEGIDIVNVLDWLLS